MNKELEYLLSEIKDSSQDYVGTNGCKYQDLLREELDLLLNYITNLQTIEQQYCAILSENADLQQENDKLGKENKKYKDLGFEHLQKENDRLNNIINTAIKYIQNNKLYDFIYDDEELFEKVSDKATKDYLLYILKGDNNG